MKRIFHFIKEFRRWRWRLVVEFFRLLGGKSIRLGGPKGFFSVWENPSQVELVLSGQTVIPAPAGCLRDICRFEQNRVQPWPIFWMKIPKARLVGKSLIVLNDEKKLMLEAVYGNMFARADPSYNYLWLPPATHLEGAWTSVLSRWYPSGHKNYFHWLTDALPRLAILDRFPSDTRILVPEPLSQFHRDSLEILNLLDRCRPTPEIHLLLEDYYYSSPTTMTGCDNPYMIQFLRDRFLSHAALAAPSFEKIYIVRKGTSRQAIHEEEMIDFLKGEGWAIVQSENYSFREQIAIFRNARAVCSIHGAGLTNIIWCQPGSKVLELCPENFLNGCYEGLAPYLGLDHRFLIFEADRKSRMKVDMKKFIPAIKALG